RDRTVTGVQTCALPIYQHGIEAHLSDRGISITPYESWRIERLDVLKPFCHRVALAHQLACDLYTRQNSWFVLWLWQVNCLIEIRSEERRVGKECRYRW